VLTLLVTMEGELAIRAGRSGRLITVGAIAPGDWHHVQVHARVAGADGLVVVWLDDEPVNDKGARLGSGKIVAVQVGETAADRTFGVAFDNVAIDRECIGACSDAPEATAEPTREPRPRPTEPAEPAVTEEPEATPALEDSEPTETAEPTATPEPTVEQEETGAEEATEEPSPDESGGTGEGT